MIITLWLSFHEIVAESLRGGSEAYAVLAPIDFRLVKIPFESNLVRHPSPAAV